MDKLDDIFNKQRTLQGRLKSDLFSQQFRNTMTMAAMVELSEFIMWTPWKPWKKNQPYGPKEIKEAKLELVDVMHFLTNLALSMGMTSQEFHSLFIEKNKENHYRQDKGY